jgi:hypothetical protein
LSRITKAAGVISIAFASAGFASAQVTDEAQAEATTMLTRFEFADAFDAFGELLEDAEPKSQAWVEAAMGRALAAESLTPTNFDAVLESRRLYEEIAALDLPEFSPRARLNLGRSYEVRWTGDQPIRLDDAREVYAALLADRPDDEYGDLAAMRLAGTYLQVVEDPASVRRGIEILTQRAEARPEAPLTPGLWEAAGRAHLMLLDEPVQGVRALRKALQLGLLNPRDVPDRYWLVATAAEDERAKMYEVSAQYYRKIVVETPRSGRSFEAHQALQRLLAEHGDLGVTLPPLSDDLVATVQAAEPEEDSTDE